MGFSLVDAGVMVATGRGAQAVSMVISFERIEAWSRRMNKDRRELWRLSYGRAAAGLKRKLYSVMRHGGGVVGVPKFRDFEDFTRELRALRGASSRMGGVLAERSSMVMFKRNGAQVIGWHDALESVAESFQDGAGGADTDDYLNDPSRRRYWHKSGIRDIPRAYVHNPRQILVPYFMAFVKQNLDAWAKKEYYTGLAKLMQGKRDARFAGANL